MASKKAAPEYIFPGGFKPDELGFSPPSEPSHGVDIASLTPAQKLALLAELTQQMQSDKDTLSRVEKILSGQAPVLIIAAGDFHFGSYATNAPMLEKIQKIILNWPDAYLIILGDEIDGRGKYPTSDARSHSVQDQLDLFRTWLRPMYDAGKILCAVGEYDGHVGWIVDADGGMSWQGLYGDMQIPVVSNGRMLSLLREKNGETETVADIAVAHNSGRRSQYDPVHGLRSLADSAGANTALAGHTHTFGMEVDYSWGPEGEVVRTTLVNSGTAKGVPTQGSVDVADTFGVRNAWGPVSPLGSGVIFTGATEKSGSADGIPFASPEEGLLLHAALGLLNGEVAEKLTDELIGQMREPNKKRPAVNKLKYVYDQSSQGVGATELEQQQRRVLMARAQARMSRDDDQDYQHMESDWFHDPDMPVYQRLVTEYDPGGLPFALHLLANMRLSATSFREADFNEYLARLNKPWDLLLWLRGLVDSDLGRLSTRLEYLNQAKNMLLPTRGRNVGLLLDGAMRSAAWKGTAGGVPQDALLTKEGIIQYGPIAPGSFLSRETGVPLLGNDGLLEMRVGNAAQSKLFVAALMDRLRNSGSYNKPIFGLQRAYQNHAFPQRPSAVLGGHMPGSGYGKIYDNQNPLTQNPLFVAPGWWSNVDTMGRGNVSEGSPPELAVILAPLETQLITYVVRGQEEYDLLMNALTLQLGFIKDPKLAAKAKKSSGAKTSRR